VSITMPMSARYIFPVEADIKEGDRDDFIKILEQFLYGGEVKIKDPGSGEIKEHKMESVLLSSLRANASYLPSKTRIQCKKFKDLVNFEGSLKHEAIHHLSMPRLNLNRKEGNIIAFDAAREDITMAITLLTYYNYEGEEGLNRFSKMFTLAVRDIFQAGRSMVRENLPYGDSQFMLAVLSSVLRDPKWMGQFESVASACEHDPYEFGRFRGILLAGIFAENYELYGENIIESLIKFLKDSEKYKKNYSKRSKHDQGLIDEQVDEIAHRVSMHVSNARVLWKHEYKQKGDWSFESFASWHEFYPDRDDLLPEDFSFGLGLTDFSVFKHYHSLYDLLKEKQTEEQFKTPIEKVLFETMELPYVIVQGIAGTGASLQKTHGESASTEYVRALGSNGMAVDINHYFKTKFQKTRGFFGRARMNSMTLQEQFIDTILYRMIIREVNDKNEIIDPRLTNPDVLKAVIKTAGTRDNPGWLNLASKGGELDFNTLYKTLTEIILPEFRKLEEIEKLRRELEELYRKARSEREKEALKQARLALENQGESGMTEEQKKAMNQARKDAWENMTEEEKNEIIERLKKEAEAAQNKPKNPISEDEDDFKLPIPGEGEGSDSEPKEGDQTTPPKIQSDYDKQKGKGQAGKQEGKPKESKDDSVESMEDAIKNLQKMIDDLKNDSGKAKGEASKVADSLDNGTDKDDLSDKIRKSGEAIDKSSKGLSKHTQQIKNKANSKEGELKDKMREGKDVGDALGTNGKIKKQAEDAQGKSREVEELGKKIKELTKELADRLKDKEGSRSGIDQASHQTSQTLGDLDKALGDLAGKAKDIQKQISKLQGELDKLEGKGEGEGEDADKPEEGKEGKGKGKEGKDKSDADKEGKGKDGKPEAGDKDKGKDKGEGKPESGDAKEGEDAGDESGDKGKAADAGKPDSEKPQGPSAADFDGLEPQTDKAEKNPESVTPSQSGSAKGKHKMPNANKGGDFEPPEIDAKGLLDVEIAESGMETEEYDFFNFLLPPDFQPGKGDFYKAIVPDNDKVKQWKNRGNLKGLVRAVMGQPGAQRKLDPELPGYRTSFLLDLSGSMGWGADESEELPVWKIQNMQQVEKILPALIKKMKLGEDDAKVYA
ncbi:MAG: hypothetical protein ACD_79C00143G0001, partial [uncultured bacterium]